LALICTSAYAGDPSIWKDRWRDSPLTSKTSNEWRKKPYVSKTTDSWRNLPQSARQSQSKLRWNKDEWQTEEKKEYVKPQMETIDESVETNSEKASQNLGNAENHFVVYSGKNSFKIDKNAKKHVHSAPGGLIEIYSSSAPIN
jgi:hypothetical protein